MGILDKYILNAEGNVRREPDLLKWAQWFETAERHIGLDRLPNGTKVSTVFLGTDHNFEGGTPILWETMIFGGPEDQYQKRYATREEALIGHAKAVKLAISAGGDKNG